MDSAFKFRLQKVLDLKLQAEKEYMIVHSKILSEKVFLENEINKLEFQYENYAQMQYQDISTLNKKIAYNYMNSLFQSIQNHKEKLVEADKRYIESTKKLVSLQSERKSLEKLKEKQYRKFIKDMEEEEAIQNDEFAIYSYFRNTQN